MERAHPARLAAAGMLVCAAWLAFAAPAGAAQSITSALIQVAGTLSPILLSAGRDADVRITTSGGGMITARMDSVRDLNSGELTNATGNRLELETRVNGGAPTVLMRPFDFSEGRFIVIAPLGLAPGDVVELVRLDLYDSNNDRFATLGIRIAN